MLQNQKLPLKDLIQRNEMTIPKILFEEIEFIESFPTTTTTTTSTPTTTTTTTTIEPPPDPPTTTTTTTLS